MDSREGLDPGYAPEARDIIRIDGLWWPEQDLWGRRAILSEVGAAIPWLLSHTRGNGTIVQAGANVGVYPIELAKHFRDVLCFEPDPVNYQCAILNGCDDRVNLFNFALGETTTLAAMDHLEPDNCGAHRLKAGNSVTVKRLDSNFGKFCRPKCDAIWLDVEGYELPALRGAIKTIEEHHPLIVTEEKGLGSQYGICEGEIAAFLAQFGYVEIDRHGNDRAYL